MVQLDSVAVMQMHLDLEDAAKQPAFVGLEMEPMVVFVPRAAVLDVVLVLQMVDVEATVVIVRWDIAELIMD